MSERYRTIVVDPPWRYVSSLPGFEGAPHDTSGKARGEGERRSLPYSTLTVEEIAALPVRDLAERDAHLYLWTTNTHLEHAWAVLRAWGFKYSTTLVWCKPPRGFSGFPTYNSCTEYVLFARRGNLRASARMDRNWWEWPRTLHSAKPDAFLDLVERVSPGPYAELFARRARFGWDYPIGDQALGGVAA